MKYLPFLSIGLALSLLSCNSTKKTTTDTKQNTEMNTTTTAPTNTSGYRYKYETVAGDPLNALIYTLDNGLKIYMSVYQDAPRVQTMIAVRAGSKFDPAETTGLAHYLEHMMFKGTNHIGTINWDEEQKVLATISDLYEQHRNEKNPDKRKAIYAQIDSVSNVAAKYVVANEYDKMVSSLGAQGTNAYTSNEETVYVNDIPSNELDKWVKLEAERFNMLVLRLFHTELEAVYEEFNIGQDNDQRKAFYAMMANLFPNHPYGTQTTIGKGEHLKNPSHVKIHEYFNKYYVPNNMAIVLSGDFDPDHMVDVIKQNWGSYKRKEVAQWVSPKENPLTQPTQVDVLGQKDPFVQIGIRIDQGQAGTKDAILTEMLGQILNNGRAGLMDINLIQEQKVLDASAGAYILDDYSIFILSGKPRENQTLEQVKDLLLAELDKVRSGNFEEWLLDASVKDIKLSEIKQYESNRGRTSALVSAFIRYDNWAQYVNRWNQLESITKADVVDFAKRLTAPVIVYKRTGSDPNVLKVEKPKITPVTLNRKDESPFLADFKKINSSPIQPDFVDFNSAIKKLTLSNGIELNYVENPNNSTFNLYYILEMGKNHNKKLPLAIRYLPYLGTDKYTPAQLQEEFFKLGVAMDVFSGEDRCYVTLSGLEESLEKGIQLFEHVLTNVKADKATLESLKNDILTERTNAKKDKNTIIRQALPNYAKYGTKSSFTDVLTEAQLTAITETELTNIIKSLSAYPHYMFYYGQKSAAEAQKLLEKYHKLPTTQLALPTPMDYPEVATNGKKIYFVNFPMVQTEIRFISKGATYDPQQYVMSQLYNNYFGSGLSSIVFQEIRESKALAYSANAFYSSPTYKDRAHYMGAYVGTQADKMESAITAMRDIIENMPVSESQIETARQSLLSSISSERITKTRIFFEALSNRQLGIDYDRRRDVYTALSNKEVNQRLIEFQKNNVKGRDYTMMVLGDKSRIDMKYLQSLGDVQELTLEQVFGY